MLQAEQEKARKEYLKMKRSEQYNKEKEFKATVLEKICDSNDSPDDDDFDMFHEMMEGEKNRYKKWHKKNSENVKARKAKYYAENAEEINR